jgi:hypothetical protein
MRREVGADRLHDLGGHGEDLVALTLPGADDLEEVRIQQFNPGNLTRRFQSVNTDIQKRLRYL